MHYEENINWSLVQRNMEDDAEEVYEGYKKEFPIEDYKKIAELMAKAYISTLHGNKSCNAYSDWWLPEKYAYAVLGMIEEYYQEEKESAEYERECDFRDADEPCYMEF